MRYRVTCTSKHPSGERITRLGCTAETNSYQYFSEKEVISRLDLHQDSFYVERPQGHTVEVEVARRGSERYLKTDADGEIPNNLLSLKHCPPQKPVVPPVRSVIPAASHGTQLPLFGASRDK